MQNFRCKVTAVWDHLVQAKGRQRGQKRDLERHCRRKGLSSVPSAAPAGHRGRKHSVASSFPRTLPRLVLQCAVWQDTSSRLAFPSPLEGRFPASSSSDTTVNSLPCSEPQVCEDRWGSFFLWQIHLSTRGRTCPLHLILIFFRVLFIYYWRIPCHSNLVIFNLFVLNLLCSQETVLSVFWTLMKYARLPILQGVLFLISSSQTPPQLTGYILFKTNLNTGNKLRLNVHCNKKSFYKANFLLPNDSSYISQFIISFQKLIYCIKVGKIYTA